MARVERYFVDLLDSNDGLIRRLETSHKGSITFNVNKEIRSGGKITIVNPPEINWLNSRLKVWYQNGQSDPMPLGVYIPTAPMRDVDSVLNSYPVEFHDKTKILESDKVSETFSVEEGMLVTDVVRDILYSTGETSVNITESDIELSSPRHWEPGTTKLRIINDLLDSINYFSIFVDRNGIFQAKPYRRPQDRPLSRVFQRGEDSIHSAKWSREQNIDDIPNLVILRSQGTADNEGIVGVAQNLNPDSPYSFQNRGDGTMEGGRWIAFVETGYEFDSEATANSVAERRLAEKSKASATIELEHAVVPQDLNDVVRFISDDIDTLAVVERMDFRTNPGSLCKVIWREVAEI